MAAVDEVEIQRNASSMIKFEMIYLYIKITISCNASSHLYTDQVHFVRKFLDKQPDILFFLLIVHF